MKAKALGRAESISATIRFSCLGIFWEDVMIRASELSGEDLLPTVGR